jgi:outer membrane protein OmpA-like peptidoglycan-associated protein
MMRSPASFTLCVAVALLGVACATKDFVREQVGALDQKFGERMTATQAQLAERAELQETRLRETTERTGENRRAVDAADQRLTGLVTRVGEVGVLAESARTRAELATAVAQDAEDRLVQRFASRNKYRLLDTKSVYFGSGQVELGTRDVRELDELARTLASDPNAILELRGFADSQGSDRYNREVARERVEAVVNYLVQKHGTELRQLRSAAMGKVALGAGEKPTADALARARRVEARLFTPWSSWEDSQALGGATTPTTTVAEQPDGTAPSALPKEAMDESQPRRRLPGLLRTITPKDLGAQ